ncbi:hypothetical protein HID58_096243 [Brassica napus]|uniref:Uncharacterized protein n=1 Tax=Brassica napus TaxID=3708 RepID=A0ABQ7X1A1_BRANA|nr:hypothetical protein HID58_096243 [Brassica napus]
MKWRAEDQERQLKYDNLRQTLPQMTMKTDLDPVEKTHKPSGNFGRKIYPGGFQFPQWPQFIKSCSKIYHVSGSANLQTEETGESHKSVQFELSLFNGKIKGKPPEGDSENRREALEYKVSVSENGGSNLELIGGNGTDNFSFSIYVKQQTGRLVKTFCGRQLSEFCLAVQVWEPGGKSDKDVQLVDVHYQFINGREWDFLESVEELSKVEPRPPEMIKPKNLVSLLDTGALVYKINKEATLSIMDVKLTMESSGEHSRVGILIAEMASLTKVAGAVLQGLSLWILAEEQVQEKTLWEVKRNDRGKRRGLDSSLHSLFLER